MGIERNIYGQTREGESVGYALVNSSKKAASFTWTPNSVALLSRCRRESPSTIRNFSGEKAWSRCSWLRSGRRPTQMQFPQPFECVCCVTNHRTHDSDSRRQYNQSIGNQVADFFVPVMNQHLQQYRIDACPRRRISRQDFCRDCVWPNFSF